MSTKFLIPLCAAAALLAACSDRDKDTGVGGNSDNEMSPGTTTTPAQPSETPPPPTDTPPPPSDTTPPPPPDAQPTNPPPGG